MEVVIDPAIVYAARTLVAGYLPAMEVLPRLSAQFGEFQVTFCLEKGRFLKRGFLKERLNGERIDNVYVVILLFAISRC